MRKIITNRIGIELSTIPAMAILPLFFLITASIPKLNPTMPIGGDKIKRSNNTRGRD